MKSFIIRIIKKIVVGMLLLFGYNIFLSSLNVMIPINAITIAIVSILDIPGIFGILLFYLINY